MNERKMTIDEVEQLVDNVLSENKCDTTVSSVEPSSSGDYCTVVLGGDVWWNVLKCISEAVGDEPIISGEEYNEISLFFRIPNTGAICNGSDDDKDEYDEQEEYKENTAPAIPADMRHKERFYDSVDIVVPGTEVKCSSTEQNERIMAWMKKMNCYPIVFIRLDDGVHVEVSDIYDQKVRDVLERGEAVGGDGRKYKIENPDNIFPIGDSICVRATCIETGRGDVYGLDFFV